MHNQMRKITSAFDQWEPELGQLTSNEVERTLESSTNTELYNNNTSMLPYSLTSQQLNPTDTKLVK